MQVVHETVTAYLTMQPRISINLARYSYYVGCGPADLFDSDVHIMLRTRTPYDETDEELTYSAADVLNQADSVMVGIPVLGFAMTTSFCRFV